MTVANATHTNERKDMLATDIIAISLALVTAVGLLIHGARINARLEKENRYLRRQVKEMRKQISNMVERPF
jgi:hypothetical protein